MPEIIHFGAGNLGKGFIIPILRESGYEVIVVDAFRQLTDELKLKKQYIQHIIDNEEGNRDFTITISECFNLVDDRKQIKEMLKDHNIITTSVRKENLIHVAELVGEVWNDERNADRCVICCENIENAHEYFMSLLDGLAKDDEQKRRFALIRVPDVMVDRACSPGPYGLLSVNTEKFYEICVDKNVLEDTGIRLIPAVADTEKIFARKRFLLNTMVDAISFMGLWRGRTSFQETISDADIINDLQDYFSLVKLYLSKAYDFTMSEIEHLIAETYKPRFVMKEGQSEGFERALDDIARDMLRKLTLQERFVLPLTWLYDHGYDIDKGLYLITMIAAHEAKMNGFSYEEICERMKDMWDKSEAGKYIYMKVIEDLKRYM